MNTQKPANVSAVKLSSLAMSAPQNKIPDGKIIVLIGSFAPIHLGHIELINNAANWVVSQGRTVRSAVLVPNSQTYVENKLRDSPHRHIASLEERLAKMEDFTPCFLAETETPVFIDDVSCRYVPDGALLNVISISNITVLFNCEPEDIIVVLGSDQLKSMQPYWRRTESVVFARPGYNDEMYAMLRKRWVHKALRLFKLSIVERPEGCVSTSSTQIRDQWSMEIKMRHLTVDTVLMKVITKDDIQRYISK